MMILTILAPCGIIGIAAGLFGLYLAHMLIGDGSADRAAETRHNAQLILATGVALLLVAMTWTG